MATIIVRQVSEATHARLLARASEAGRSVDAEVCAILEEVLPAPKEESPPDDFGWRDRILAVVDKYGAGAPDLASLIPPRELGDRPLPFVDY